MTKKLSRDQKRKQKKQKRAQRQRQGVGLGQYAKIVDRFKESGLNNYKLVYDPPEYNKMSAVLLDFIAPYQELAPTTEAMHKLITIALVAWNTALLPEAEQEKSLEQFSRSFPPEAIEDFYAIVKELIDRKNEYFADYTRNILDYELTETADGYHISVISTIALEK